jgi:hypothetical protein
MAWNVNPTSSVIPIEYGLTLEPMIEESKFHGSVVIK